MTDAKDLPQPQPPEDPGKKMDRMAEVATAAAKERNRTIFGAVLKRARERGLDKAFANWDPIHKSDRWYRPVDVPSGIREEMKKGFDSSLALQAGLVDAILSAEYEFVEHHYNYGPREMIPEDAWDIYQEEMDPTQEHFIDFLVQDIPDELERWSAREIATYVARTYRYYVTPRFNPEEALMLYSAFKAGEFKPYNQAINEATDKAA